MMEGGLGWPWVGGCAEPLDGRSEFSLAGAAQVERCVDATGSGGGPLLALQLGRTAVDALVACPVLTGWTAGAHCPLSYNGRRPGGLLAQSG